MLTRQGGAGRTMSDELNDPAAFSARIAGLREGLPQSGRIWVAYSGGMDSHVLLDLLCALREHPAARHWSRLLHAVHVCHGLHPEAEHWVRHCQRICTRLQLPLRVLRLSGSPPAGAGVEAWARQHRYQALSELLSMDELLLCAHHRADQAETVLLQLLRGSGPAGLAAMPALRRLGPGWLGRPLLDRERGDLRCYARRRELDWIEDSGNRDPCHARNFLRLDVLPRLRARWPAIERSLAAVATHQAETLRLSRQLAALDLAAFDERLGTTPGLSLPLLRELDPDRARNLLRLWLWQAGGGRPGGNLLRQIVEQLAGARADRNPCLHWGALALRRYRDRLYLQRPLPPPPVLPLRWHPGTPLELPLGRLCAAPVQGQGLRARLVPRSGLEVRFRQGGESLRAEAAASRHKLKKFFQEKAVFPWIRSFIPLIYSADRIVQIPPLWLAADCRAGPGEAAFEIRWEQAPLLCGPATEHRRSADRQ